MPLYEYQCEACGRRFERIQKFSDPPVETCPTCGGKVHKLISSPAFQFKGTGWYVTDYSRKDKGRDAGESGASDASSESGDAAKAKDAKPAPDTTVSKDTPSSSDAGSKSGDGSAAKDSQPTKPTPPSSSKA